MRKFMFVFAVALALTGCRKNPDVDPGNGGGDEEVPPVVTEPAYSVGDLYDKGFVKGIVVYVDETGEHGSVVSLDEFEAAWSYANEEVMGSYPDEKGMVNTKLVYLANNWRENYPGFAWCSDKNVMGLEKWYIPTGTEIYRIYSVYAEPQDESVTDSKAWLNGILAENGGTALSDSRYWTSEEIGRGMANVFDMGKGSYVDYPTELQKTLVYKFRAMADF